MVATIKLTSSDDEKFEVPIDVAKMSTTINNLITDLGIDENDEEELENREAIPIQNVNAVVMKKVLEWCEQHKGEDPPEEVTDNRELCTDNIESWDQEYLEVSHKELYDIILAANYLDIRGLLDVSCKHVAHNLAKGKSVEELRETFGIVNDFTDEEIETIKRENAWCED